MEKRLVLAIALSLLVLLIWSTLVTKTYYIENKEVTAKDSSFIPTAPQETPALITTEKEIPTASLFEYPQDKFKITFIEPQAAIKEVIFKAYQNYIFPLQYGFLLKDKTLNFKKESSTSNTITFMHSDSTKRITKKFIFHNSNYSIELEIKIQNLSSAAISVNLPLVLGVLDFSAQNKEARYQDVTITTKERPLHFNARKNQQIENVQSVSLRDRYFCTIVDPEVNEYTGFIKRIDPEKTEVGIISSDLVLNNGQQLEEKFHIYLGPQELRLINSIKPEWSQVIYYGSFDFIAQILLQLLEFFYRLAHNWGGAIVILSLAVFILLYPLTLKQMRSIKEIQALQPRIEEIRNLYKDNPQRLNKEIIELYREHKVNPLGGCLPLILQIPIFFALYQVLMRSVALKGASFLWIKDLSGPDKLFLLPVSLPVLGNEINILPILMTIGMFIQQKISATSTTSTSAEQQKIMQIIFPLMFGIIFYHMPSGLVLYWFINSSLMLLYQLRITRIK